MFYHLFYYPHGVFRVFRYISFRVVMAMLTALVIGFVLGPWLINYLKKNQIGQHVRDDGPKAHLSKAGTPTMGGVLIIASMLFSFLLWARLDVSYTWIVALTTLGYGAVGFYDDYLKIYRKNSKGLSMRAKLKFQLGFALLAVGALLWAGLETNLMFPFFKDAPDIGWWGFIPLAVCVIVGASNAVNLTDGLDGLAIGPVLVAALAYIIFTYIAGHSEFSRYLQVRYVPGAGEVAVFCGAIVGAGLGFLWFNTYPAQVFMGDVGSLALGAALGMVALVCKQELALVIVGGIFVLEAASVIIQVISFKTTGKRIFKMAPIHHHFELKGWAEPKVIVRFWIISIILALLALSTLKLR